MWVVRVLVIDIGGSSVKVHLPGHQDPVRIESGKHLDPDILVAEVRRLTSDDSYDLVSIGYPGQMAITVPVGEPGNLGGGWVGYDFEAEFGKPVRILNDAAMQALGAYEGGRMLFLGLGTGLGSALVSDRVIVSLELGCLPLTEQETMASRLGRAGLDRVGLDTWKQSVLKIAGVLRESFVADYVMLGGGNAEKIEALPSTIRRGGNNDAATGGIRLWEHWVKSHDAEPLTWTVVS